MSTRRRHQELQQPQSLDYQDLVAARKRLRPASPATRPPTSHPPGELQDARGRLRAVTPSPWVTPTVEPPRTALIWHPQENYIGPAVLTTPVTYTQPVVTRVAHTACNYTDEWTSVRGISPNVSRSPSPNPQLTARNLNDIPILNPSRLNTNNNRYFSSDFSSSASSSRPKTSRASSSSRSSASIRLENPRPKTRGGPNVRGTLPDYTGHRPVTSAARHLSPSHGGDYGQYLRPISRGPSPSRGVTVLYERPVMSRVASPDYDEIRSREPSPVPSGFSSQMRPKSRGRPVTQAGKPPSQGETTYIRPRPRGQHDSIPQGTSPSPSISTGVSPASSAYSRPKSRGVSPSLAYGLPPRTAGPSPSPTGYKSRGASPSVGHRSRVASPSPTRSKNLAAPPRGRPVTRGGKKEKREIMKDELLEEPPPRTPATMPIVMPAPEIPAPHSVVRIAPATLRSRSRQRGSTAFVVWHDAPYAPPPRTPKHNTDTKKTTKNSKGAQAGSQGETAAEGEQKDEIPHVMEKGDWGRRSPIPGALGAKKNENEILGEDEGVEFDAVSAMIHLGAADLVNKEITGNWEAKKSRFNSTASTIGMAGRMSGTRRRFIETSANGEDGTKGESVTASEEPQQQSESMQGIIQYDSESESQSGPAKLTTALSPIMSVESTGSGSPGTSSVAVTEPSPAVASTAVPAGGGSALAAAMMSGSAGGGSVIVAGSGGNSQNAAMTMVSSTTVTGTSVTGIPTTISIPSSSAVSDTISMAGSPPSSATSTATVRAGGVAAHSAAPAATAVSEVLSRPGSVTAVSPVPAAIMSGTDYDSSSAAASTVNSASSTGRFSAGLSSASARVRRFGTSSFKQAKSGVQEEGLQEEEEDEEEEEKEPEISMEANKIKELLLTEGLTGEDMAARLQDIMLLHEMSSSEAATFVIEALTSQGIAGGMLLKRMAAVPPGSGMNTGESAVVLGNILSAHSEKAIAQAYEKATAKIAKVAKPVKPLNKGKSVPKNINNPYNTSMSRTSTMSSMMGSVIPSTSAMSSASTVQSASAISASSEATKTNVTEIPSSAGTTKESKSPVPPSAGKRRGGFMKQFEAVNTAFVQVSRFTRRQSVQSVTLPSTPTAAQESDHPVAPGGVDKTMSSATQPAQDKTKAVTDMVKSSVIDTTKHAIDTAKSSMENKGMDSAISRMDKSMTSTVSSGIDTAKSAMDTTKSVMDMTKPSLDSAKSTMDSAKSTMDSAKSTMDSAKSTMVSVKSTMDTNKPTMDTAKSTVDTVKSTIDTTKLTMDTDKSIMDMSKPTMDIGKSTMDSAKTTAKTGLITTQALIETEKASTDKSKVPASGTSTGSKETTEKATAMGKPTGKGMVTTGLGKPSSGPSTTAGGGGGGKPSTSGGSSVQTVQKGSK